MLWAQDAQVETDPKSGNSSCLAVRQADRRRDAAGSSRIDPDPVLVVIWSHMPRINVEPVKRRMKVFDAHWTLKLWRAAIMRIPEVSNFIDVGIDRTLSSSDKNFDQLSNVGQRRTRHRVDLARASSHAALHGHSGVRHDINMWTASQQCPQTLDLNSFLSHPGK